jgi:hypothetical protein
MMSLLEVRLTSRTVEVFAKGERIAVQMRGSGNGKAYHRHRSHAIQSSALRRLGHRPHPQGRRLRAGNRGASYNRASGPCPGILRLARPFGVGRLEAAASRASEIGALTFGSVRSILDHKLDRHAADQRQEDGAPILHPNIRGARYYN